MKKYSSILLLSVFLTGYATAQNSALTPQKSIQIEESIMQLGNFSVSLTVKDIAVSRAFYEKLGFTVFGGDQEQNWLIMKNGSTKIGLFQGMFEHNILTFNPGWDSDAKQLPKFTDIRKLQRSLKKNGISLQTEADESTTGPASFMFKDPDGNQILIDQHVSSSE